MIFKNLFQHKFLLRTGAALLLAGALVLTGPLSTAEAGDPPYLIMVNRLQNCVTVYTQDEAGEYTIPYKAMICSTGGELTPTGVYQIPIKYRWRALVEETWGQYSTRINGPYLFHSVPYDEQDPSTMLPGEYNKLGEAASHGCIRLTVEDARWIYENVQLGTTVIIYDDENPGPLGKPETVKLGKVDNWDPTDSWSKGNPYIAATPEITINGNLKLYVGDTDYNLLEGVTATSSVGEDITWSVKVEGAEKIALDKPGFYRLTYRVTDGIGRTDECLRYVRVTAAADHAISLPAEDELQVEDELQAEDELPTENEPLTEEESALENNAPGEDEHTHME